MKYENVSSLVLRCQYWTKKGTVDGKQPYRIFKILKVFVDQDEVNITLIHSVIFNLGGTDGHDKGYFKREHYLFLSTMK